MDPREQRLEHTAIGRALRRVRARARSVLIARSGGWLIGVALLTLAAWALVDFELRFEPWARWTAWIAGLIALGAWIRRSALPAWRFRPSLTDVALRIEQHGELTGTLRGELASGLEFSAGERGTDLERALARSTAGRVEARVAELVRTGRGRRLVSWKPVRVALPVALLGLLVAGLFGVTEPALARTGAARALMPWSDAAWPKRTLIADRTEPRVRETGVDLVLHAELLRTHRAPGRTPVTAFVRLGSDEGSLGTPRAIPMVRQDAADDEEDGEVFSARVELPRRAGVPEQVIEYWFETEDDRTPSARLRAVDAPVLRSARVRIEPPAYLGASPESRELDHASPEPQRLGPIFAGSRVEIELSFSKDAAAEAWSREPGATPGLEDLLAAAADARGESAVERGDRSLAIRGTLAGTLDLGVRLRDEYGIATPPDRIPAFRVEVVDDAIPSVSITEPAHDEAVLASAMLPIAARGEDDVALRWLAVEAQRSTPPTSAGAPPEPAGVARELTRLEGGREPSLAAELELDLSSFDLAPGDELTISSVTQDSFELFGEAHQPVRSEPRTLRIISEQELSEALREQLGVVRDEARRLDERQRDLAQQRRAARDAGQDADRAGEARQQQGLGEQIESTRAAVERVRERLERNRLEDTALSSLTEGSREALERAGEASAQAEAALERADGSPEGSEPQQQAERDASEAQAEVREELARVAELLDRGEDAWIVQRAIDSLIEQQERLAEQTRDAGERIADGASTESLTPAERSELERIAERQREALREAERALDELNERSRQLREANPTQAEAMERAASAGREQGLTQSLEDAAEQIEQNQTGQAGQSQQQAIETLEQMKEEIENADRRRDEVLRRVLAQVMELLDGLVAGQRNEIDALQRARDADGDFAPRGDAMRELHVATLGVVDRIEVSFAELRTVAALVDEAATAQQEAIVALRLEPADHAGALVAENLSLTRLLDARAEAKRLEAEAEQRDRARERQELRAKYAEILQRQVALLGETRAFEGRELGRREKYSVRALGEQQRTIASDVTTLADETESFADAALFVFAHRRLDAAMEGSASALVERTEVEASIASQQQAIRVLRSILESLDDQQSQPPDFNAGAGAAGEGGGAGAQDEPLIPPVAELKLLRSMQVEALELTRRFESTDRPGMSEAQLADLQRQLAELGRELIDRMSQQGGVAPGGEPEAGPNEEPGS
ncbi:MAG: hypothetical protein ACF8SC_13025 [Phycisphaerales bacterium JB037]